MATDLPDFHLGLLRELVDHEGDGLTASHLGSTLTKSGVPSAGASATARFALARLCRSRHVAKVPAKPVARYRITAIGRRTLGQWQPAIRPAARDLPAAADLAPVTAIPEHRNRRRRVDPTPLSPEAPFLPLADDEPGPVVPVEQAPIAAAQVAPATARKYVRSTRLPQSAFPLGERWKARLPSVSLDDGGVLNQGRRRGRRKLTP